MVLRPGICVVSVGLIGAMVCTVGIRAVEAQGPTQERVWQPNLQPATTGTSTGTSTGPGMPAVNRRQPTVEDRASSGGVPVELPSQPETLQRAWTTALAADQHLEAERWILSSADQSLLLARAQRRPELSLDSGYTVRENEPAFLFNIQGVPVPQGSFPFEQSEFFSLRTSVDVPLYTSGRIQYGIDAAEARLFVRELNVASTTLDLKMQVAQEYIAILRAQRELEVARTNVVEELDRRQASPRTSSRSNLS